MNLSRVNWQRVLISSELERNLFSSEHYRVGLEQVLRNITLLEPIHPPDSEHS